MESLKTPNKNRAAFACSDPEYLQIGLTKREYFAGQALQGILASHANPGAGNPAYTLIDSVKLAVEYADNLIKELEKD
jgi:hypothetical protein